MKKTIFLLLSAVLLLAASVRAEPLNPQLIPADAKWLVHVDFNKFAQSEIWALINQEISEKDRKKIDAVATLLGSDPTKDLFGVTLFGPDANEKNAVAIINGRFNREKLLSLLVLNDAYDESKYHGQTLYHWVDEKDNKAKVGFFATETLIVISQTETPVQAMVDLLAGPADSQSSEPTPLTSSLAKAPKDAIVVLAANGLSKFRRNDEQNVFLQNSKTIMLFAGETEGELFLTASLTTDSPETALQIEQAVNGMKAFIALENSENPKIISLLQAVTIKQNENLLFLTTKYPSAELFEILKEKYHAINKPIG
ncbi:MAG: hypothetical protein JXD22_00430 [Sedimentisphaerales bacterium]|nr:hypothetical protein [Sedimentisphaerales bacterium]